MLAFLENYRWRRIETQRRMTDDEREADNRHRLGIWTNAGLGLSVALGMVVVLKHGGVLTCGMSTYGSALGVGGVLGFLFGVPSSASARQTIQQVGTLTIASDGAKAVGGNVSGTSDPAAGKTAADDGTSDPRPRKSLSGTSNLEQVADWVTKLLLGGGLTQIGKIPHKIWQWAFAAGVGILGVNADGKDWSPQALYAAQSYAAGVLVYGFVLGFFAGYLLTKLQLGKAISE